MGVDSEYVLQVEPKGFPDRGREYSKAEQARRTKLPTSDMEKNADEQAWRLSGA